MNPAQVARVRRYQGATPSQRLGGFGVSLLLHLSLFAAIIFLSVTPVQQHKLDTPMLSLRQLTIGASGPKPAVQPEVGKEAAPPPKAPEPAPKAPEPAPVPVPKAPEPAPAPAPEPAKPAPVPKIAELEKQPEPPKPVEKPAPKPVPAGPTDAELLAAALAGAKAEAKPAPKASGGSSLLDDALKSAGSDAGTEKIITGESGSGVGVIALYGEVVAMEIRKRFTTRPYADGRVYEMEALIEIAANGALINASVLTPSGDPTLDANVIRAAREVGRFEPPPGERPQKLKLTFSSDIYAGQ